MLNEAQMKQIAEVLAKSLEDSVPAAVEAALDAKLKELNLSENTDIKEIKEQIKKILSKLRKTLLEHWFLLEKEMLRQSKQ